MPRTRAGTLAAAVALLAAALGPLLTERSLEVVSREFGVLATRSPFTGSLSPFLLTYLAAGCTAAGAALHSNSTSLTPALTPALTSALTLALTPAVAHGTPAGALRNFYSS